MNYLESLEYISSVNWKGSVPGLERITELMHKLGDPQDHLRFIHIGGTNGKGSTAAFVSHILTQAGYTTGLFISPFIEVFNERIQIDGRYISDEELAEITTFIRPFADSMEDAPTEFELNTAIGLLYFYRKHCDIVVLEVGMGGELDATNVIPPPEAAVITAIGLDHTEYLGSTIREIAGTKAGIIKPGSDVVLYRPEETGPDEENDFSAVREVIRARCVSEGARLYLSEPEKLTLLTRDITGQTFDSPHGILRIGMPAAYQKYNLATALKVIEVLRNRNIRISEENIREGVLRTFWPGRFEVLGRDPVFLVDGAHNPQGIDAAVKSLASVFPEQKIILIFGVLKDKDYTNMLDTVLALAKFVCCVTPDSPRALPAEALKDEVSRRHVPAAVCKSVPEALSMAFGMAHNDDVICALGSLYMIGDIKSSFHDMAKEPG